MSWGGAVKHAHTGGNGFQEHRSPPHPTSKTGGIDQTQKQQRSGVKRDPLITLACSSKGRWLLWISLYT